MSRLRPGARAPEEVGHERQAMSGYRPVTVIRATALDPCLSAS